MKNSIDRLSYVRHSSRKENIQMEAGYKNIRDVQDIT